MFRLRYSVLLLVLLLWTGCGSSAPVVVEEEVVLPEEVAEEGAPFVVFLDEAGTLLAKDLRLDVEREIGASGRPVFSAISPDGSNVILGIETNGRSELHAYNSQTQTQTTLFSGAPGTVFSGDWDPESARFYFGQYVPDGKRMGAGSIHSFSVASGSVERVPCSASRMVLRLLSGGELMVRNSDSIYRVSVSDCKTLQTIDARKWYHVSVSPSRDRMAYILRDLVYNRDTRAYEPDSTLYLASLEGGNETKVIGDKYEPRNMVWSPDGSELAYDVAARDGTDRRAVSVYSIESGRSSYLEAPDATVNSNSHPVFSPDGLTIVFRTTDPDGFQDTRWKTAGEPFSHVAPGDSEEKGAFLFSWVGKGLAFVRAPSGSATIFDVSAGKPQEQWSGPGAIFAIPIQ